MKATITELLERYRTLVAEAKALPFGTERAQIYRAAAEVEDTIMVTRSNSMGEVAMKLAALLDQPQANDAAVIADAIDDIRRITGDATVAPWERTIPGSPFATSMIRHPPFPVSASW
jgi:hypothetical protein